MEAFVAALLQPPESKRCSSKPAKPVRNLSEASLMLRKMMYSVYQPLGVEKLVHHLRVTFTNFNLSRVLKNTSGTSLQPARKVGQQKHVLQWGSTRHPLVCHPKVCLCCCPSSPHDGSRPIEAFVWQCTIRFLNLIIAFVAFVCCYFFPF